MKDSDSVVANAQAAEANKEILCDELSGLHRKNLNLNLLLKDICEQSNQSNALLDGEEVLSVFKDGIPRKRKLNTLQGK